MIIGGHYDTIAETGGANDNASGTAVVLALAKKIQGRPLPFTVRFIAFGGEEIGLEGSRFYVESLPEAERARIQFVLNLDVVGARVPLAVSGDARLRERFLELALADGVRLSTAPEDVPSDHLSFLQADIPAVILTTPEFTFIHTPEDTIDRLDAQTLAQVFRLARRFLEGFPPQPAS
ncbi:MAG: Zn-dependent exopeptidase M28 [Dehalococcoidia bacterium]|nr:Zn-dependent exopeptidase M28 [Dehalococcoidia bacterium]